MSAPGPPGGRPRPRRERDDADTRRVSFVVRPDATESEVQDLLLRAITESARQTEPLDAYTRDVLIHWGPADDAEERDDAADDAEQLS